MEKIPAAENVAETRAKSDAERVLSPTGRSHAPVAASLDSQNFAPTLRAATVACRGQLITDVEGRIASAETALNAVEQTSVEMSADGRKLFKAASDDAKEKAKALRKSVHAARGAGEEEWESARAQLAADYHAYAAALARIDSASAVPTTR